jgi:opacity protein-like surface antigen
MKKFFSITLLAFAAMICFHSTSIAQFSKGDKRVAIGVGLFSLGANATVEYGIMDDLGVGLYASYERPSLGYIGINYSYSDIQIGPRATYHLNRILNLDNDDFDLYVSGGILLRSYGYPDSYWNAYGLGSRTRYTTATLLARVGGTYNFSEKMALFADLGSGGSWVQAGVSFKF